MISDRYESRSSGVTLLELLIVISIAGLVFGPEAARGQITPE